MARSRQGAALTRAHRARQLQVRATTLRELMALWPIFDLTDPIQSFDRFSLAAITLTQARRRDSAAVAVGYLAAFGAAEGVSPASPVVARPAAPSRIAASLRATGLAGTLRAVGAGFSPQAAARNGLVQASGAVGRLVLEAGAETVMETVRADPKRTTGAFRVTGPDPCAFCAMLASRGPVYRSEDTASFQPHDHCACMPEPAYPDSQWPPSAARHREVWEEATAGVGGRDALSTFRVALEGD